MWLEDVIAKRETGLNLEASFRAKDWTESSLAEREGEEGDQTGEQYSSIGRTNEKYKRIIQVGDEKL